MTTITIYVRPTDAAEVDYISLVCHGITYTPVEVVMVNDLYRYTFKAVTEPDTTTPTLGIWVSETISTSESYGD